MEQLAGRPHLTAIAVYGLRLLPRREGATTVECGCEVLGLCARRDEDEESALREETWALGLVSSRGRRKRGKQKSRTWARITDSRKW